MPAECHCEHRDDDDRDDQADDNRFRGAELVHLHEHVDVQDDEPEADDGRQRRSDIRDES